MPTSPSRRFLLTVILVGAAASGLARPVFTQAQADSRERTLFLSAVDKSGEPIDDLRISDVIVREDGARREILRLSRAIEPIDIALLIDNSAAAEGAVIPMRSALRSFVRAMAEGNEIAVIALADRPTVVVEYTSDLKKLENGVGGLFAMSGSGMTLLDAVTETVRGLARRNAPRAMIVTVINDGPEHSTRQYRQVIDAMKTAHAQLHAVTVGTFAFSNQSEARERAFVLDLGTKESGGQRMTLLSPMGLDNALGKLARDLSTQYKVVYGRPQSLVPPEKLEIASGRRGVTLRGTPMRGQAGA